jgi:hypothetical protein
MTDAHLAATPGTAIYDYGVLLPDRTEPDRTGPLQCPCGRTDKAERAEQMIAEYLGCAPVGARAAILVRNMARDGTTGPAHIYALAERGEHCIAWPTYRGIRTPQAAERSAQPAQAEAAPPRGASQLRQPS